MNLRSPCSNSDNLMHVPELMDRVRLIGCDEVYLVLLVDYKRESADLLPVLFGGERLRKIPFSSIEALAKGGLEELVRQRRH